MDFVEFRKGGVDVVCAGFSDGRGGVMMAVDDVGRRCGNGLILVCPYWQEGLREHCS